MRLPLTRKLVYRLKSRLEPWPEMNIDLFVEQERSWLSAIGLRPGSRSISLWHASVALGEWTTTTDFERLSVWQRVVCGCGLLEYFCRMRGIDRVCPSIKTVIECLTPAHDLLSPRELRILTEAFMQLRGKREVLDLDEGELAQIDLALYVLHLRLHGVPDASIDLDNIYEQLHDSRNATGARLATLAGLPPPRTLKGKSRGHEHRFRGS